MTPRKRSRKYAGFPPNLYAKMGKNAVLYFYYRRPDNGKDIPYGTDKKAAFDAANQSNQLLSVGKDLVAKTLGLDIPFSDFLVIFENEILPTRLVNGQPLRKSTLIGYRQRIEVIRERWGKRSIKDVTLSDVAIFLDDFPARMSNIYRATLILIWKYAVARGLTDRNIPTNTIKMDETVKRKPLSKEGFEAIRKKAPAWFQKAMDLALESLQGRSEIASAQFSSIEGNIWRVIRKKTKSHGVSARLEISMWPELQAAIQNCRDDVVSPYLIHKKPEKVKPRAQQSKKRDHPTQVLAEYLSREFAKARKKSEFYSDLTSPEQPTFHEIRSLGAALKRKQGWSEALIQKLMAHSDELMTQHYLDKHETPWTRIEWE